MHVSDVGWDYTSHWPEIVRGLPDWAAGDPKTDGGKVFQCSWKCYNKNWEKGILNLKKNVFFSLAFNALFVLFLWNATPTSNGGAQNGCSVGTGTGCTHVFARFAPICMLGWCLSTKLLRRSSVRSLSRLLCLFVHLPLPGHDRGHVDGVVKEAALHRVHDEGEQRVGKVGVALQVLPGRKHTQGKKEVDRASVKLVLLYFWLLCMNRKIKNHFLAWNKHSLMGKVTNFFAPPMSNHIEKEMQILWRIGPMFCLACNLVTDRQTDRLYRYTAVVEPKFLASAPLQDWSR